MFGIFSSWCIFQTPTLKKIENILFWPPYSISNTSTILRGSLHLTDRAEISYTKFWYHQTTFETLTFLHFSKKGVFHSTLMSNLGCVASHRSRCSYDFPSLQDRKRLAEPEKLSRNKNSCGPLKSKFWALALKSPASARIFILYGYLNAFSELHSLSICGI